METKHTVNSVLWNLLIITVGGIVFSFGAKTILVHHNFIMGGLYGTALLVNYSTGLLSPGLLFLLANVPVMILGWFFFSRRFLFYSLWAVCIVTLASELITFDLHIHNQLYAAIAGGLICGTGSGIILRSYGSGGGLDIIAIILYQRYNIGIGKFFIGYNAVIFTVALYLYEIDLVIASFILTFIASSALEYMLALFNQRKIVYVLSDSAKEISELIWQDLKQGATLIEARGAYSNKQKPMLMTVTNNLQVKRLEEKVFTVDPKALFIVENSFNVIGTGFGKRKIY